MQTVRTDHVSWHISCKRDVDCLAAQAAALAQPCLRGHPHACTLCNSICVVVYAALQGFTPAFQERVSDFVLTARVTLCLCGGADEAAALRNTLAQCGELRLGKGSVCESQAHIKGYNWQWSDAAVQAAVQGIPQLPHLTFAFNCNGALTDALLGAALQLGGCMRQLYADRVSLQSDEHAGAVWPWEKVYMDSLRVSELYKMPMPRDGAVVCVEHLSSFVLDQTVSATRTHTHTHTHKHPYQSTVHAHLRRQAHIAPYGSPRPSACLFTAWRGPEMRRRLRMVSVSAVFVYARMERVFVCTPLTPFPCARRNLS